MCGELEPRPSLRIVEDADLVAAESQHHADMTSLSQSVSADSVTAGDTDPLDKVNNCCS